MKLKIDEVKKVERLQLTAQEIFVLKMLCVLDLNQTASLLAISKQRVSQVKRSAENKIDVQGILKKKEVQHDQDQD